MMPAKIKKGKPAKSSSQVKRLQAKLARLEKKLIKVSMEKNFLERAMGDLNFHNNAHDGIVFTDPQNRIVYANPYFIGMMGVQNPDEILDKPFPNYMWNNQQEADRLFKDIKTDGFVREREMALYNKDGQAIFALCSGVVSKDKDGKILGSEIMFCNITGKRTFQAEVVEQHALLDAVLQSTPDPVLILTSALDVNRMNPAAESLFGRHGAQARRTFSGLLEEANLSPELIQRAEERFASEQPFEIEVTAGGQTFEAHAAPLSSAQKGWVCVLHNITVRKQTQELLQQQAFHDVLTQLPNRAYFRDFLQRSNVRTRSEPGYRFAVFFIDMDGLKGLNDKWGHHVGDQALIQFARRLESSIRPGDLVSRLGGDEFAVLVDGVEEEANAIQLAARMQQAVSRPYKLDGQTEIQPTASIGIALSGKFTDDVDALLRNADKAMYRVKQRGGNNFEVFSEEMLSASEA